MVIYVYVCVFVIITMPCEHSVCIVFIILVGILGGGSFNPALKSQWLNPIDSQNVCGYILSTVGLFLFATAKQGSGFHYKNC